LKQKSEKRKKEGKKSRTGENYTREKGRVGHWGRKNGKGTDNSIKHQEKKELAREWKLGTQKEGHKKVPKGWHNWRRTVEGEKAREWGGREEERVREKM